MPIIIICEFVDFIKMIRIKMFALYAEVPFDRLGKELRFVGVCLCRRGAVLDNRVDPLA